jgi:hypothetical protein
MTRLYAPLFFSTLILASCAPDGDEIEHDPATGAAVVPGSGDMVLASKGAGSPSVAIPVLPTPRPGVDTCRPAPRATIQCGSDMACDSDGDCSIYPGNYCAADTCVQDDCLRGRCSPTRVQGETCTRGGECSSGVCDCGAGGGPCVCTPGKGVLFVF